MHSRLFVMLLVLLSTNAARAQVKVQECGLKSLQVCALHVAQDEVGIVTAPFHLSAPSYFWLLPFGAVTGIALEKDNEAMQAVGFDRSRQNEFRRISDYGALYGPAASVAVGYIAGSVTHNDHLQQTAVPVPSMPVLLQCPSVPAMPSTKTSHPASIAASVKASCVSG
jgi:hypothetical protein